MLNLVNLSILQSEDELSAYKQSLASNPLLKASGQVGVLRYYSE